MKSGKRECRQKFLQINEPGPNPPVIAAAGDLDKAGGGAYSAVREISFTDMLCRKETGGE
ncbi:MAG: hypothetical protein R6W99_09730 [Clostridia bacterium]